MAEKLILQNIFGGTILKIWSHCVLRTSSPQQKRSIFWKLLSIAQFFGKILWSRFPNLKLSRTGRPVMWWGDRCSDQNILQIQFCQHRYWYQQYILLAVVQFRSFHWSFQPTGSNFSCQGFERKLQEWYISILFRFLSALHCAQAMGQCVNF